MSENKEKPKEDRKPSNPWADQKIMATETLEQKSLKSKDGKVEKKV